jgi:hypothetical protein
VTSEQPGRPTENTNGEEVFTHTFAQRSFTMLCNCDSGLESERVYDARGIYLARVCDACRERRLAGFRPDIFEDSDYECDEPINEDY